MGRVLLAVYMDGPEYDQLRTIADADYEGNLSMAARRVVRRGLYCQNGHNTEANHE